MNHYSRLTILLIALSSLCLTGCATTRANKLAHGTSKISIPFSLSKQNNIIVEAQINELQVLNLMFHTASSDITLTENAVQRLVDIKFGSTAQVKSWGGTSDSRYSTENIVRIGPFVRNGITVWENKNSGDGTDGKFGLDYFEKSVIEVNYDERLITVHEQLPKNLTDYEELELENKNGQLYVQGTCRLAGVEYKNKFLIHSGYAGSILLDDAFAASSGINGKVKIIETTRLTDSFGNVIEVKKAVLPEFSLGDLKLSDVPMGFFSGGLGQQKTSVLGGELLKQFNLVFDINQNKLYIKRRSVSKMPLA